MSSRNVVASVLKRQFWSKKKVDFGKYEIVKPGNVSASNLVPNNIPTPSYYKTGIPDQPISSPEIKNSSQILSMINSCRLAANVLQQIEHVIKPGVSTEDLDNFAHDLIIKNNAYPSPLNYNFFPKSICTSVNNVACHGIPDDRKLIDGDIINVDITVFLNGYHGDCSKTFLVGNVDEPGKKLVEATEKCLYEGISVCKPGAWFRDIGSVIQDKAASMGFQIIPAFIGHGIGHYFHGPPDIYHIKSRYPGRMEVGMTFTIEPILTQGGQLIDILEDDWTAITADSARTAQFEHTILVTPDGCEILTQPSQ
ncbi:methionine aminopeptidase 1D, mitochondrial [Aethina tumida]|uniref:methionine aminopeptidase 1D, mitochondrial n=1 Tax=Aethina tumida TaxID=116153 RepID=UPI00096B5A26|nr:methionine aminopeptidase 1D, mitochondrial [Aethina tumida]